MHSLTDKQPCVKEAQIEAIQPEDAKEEADEEGLENQRWKLRSFQNSIPLRSMGLV